VRCESSRGEKKDGPREAADAFTYLIDLALRVRSHLGMRIRKFFSGLAINRGLPHFPWIWLKLCDRLRHGLRDLRIAGDGAVISDENKQRLGAHARRQDIANQADGRRLGRVSDPEGWPALSSMRRQVGPTARLVCPPSAGLAGSRSSGEASTEAGAMAVCES
jgi:hypothetical protein